MKSLLWENLLRIRRNFFRIKCDYFIGKKSMFYEGKNRSVLPRLRGKTEPWVGHYGTRFHITLFIVLFVSFWAWTKRKWSFQMIYSICNKLQVTVTLIPFTLFKVFIQQATRGCSCGIRIPTTNVVGIRIPNNHRHKYDQSGHGQTWNKSTFKLSVYLRYIFKV